MRYLLISLLAGCAAVTVPNDIYDHDSPICKVPNVKFYEVYTPPLNQAWERRFGLMPEKCKGVGFQIVIAETVDQYFETCPDNSRACQLSCDGEYTALLNPDYIHDYDLVPHEFAHAMDHCVNDYVDYNHENPELWGPNGFVSEFLPK